MNQTTGGGTLQNNTTTGQYIVPTTTGGYTGGTITARPKWKNIPSLIRPDVIVVDKRATGINTIEGEAHKLLSWKDFCDFEKFHESSLFLLGHPLSQSQ